MDLAVADYSPDVVEHVPGIANVTADALSRRFAPEAKSVPEYLPSDKEIHLPQRHRDLWKALPAEDGYEW